MFSSLRCCRRSFAPNAENLVLGLVGINAGVFILWRIMKPSFMTDSFTLTMENFQSRRLHTLLASAFSHIDLSHLVSNMVGLYFLGINIAQRFGPVFLVKLYITGGGVGSLFFLMDDALIHSLSKPNCQISGAAHLGGAVLAALFWATIKKGWF